MATIVITGASAGVGRAVARSFARPGARIGLVARSEDRLQVAAREVRAKGGEALVLPTDVADADALEVAAASTESAFGPIDIWINVAMVTVMSPVIDMTPEEYRRVTEVTYLGCVHGTLAALRRMKPRDRGTIVQIGSALAYRSVPLQSAYCAAKSAIVGFTDSLRSELNSRSVEREADRRASSGGQHAAVRLGAQQAAAQGAAPSADLRAGGHRRRDPSRGDPSATRVLAGLARDQGDHGPEDRPRSG